MGERVVLDVATVHLERVVCGKCGAVYALEENYIQRKRDYGGFWRCPYCATSWGYNQDGTELARIKRKLEYEEAASARARSRGDRYERKLRATKGVVTKMKKRAANGVCPCCNRHFVNLQRHMDGQHPDFVKGKS